MSDHLDVPPGAPRARVHALGPYGLVVATWCALVWRTWVSIGGRLHVVLVDDAMISMSFARTWARTGELVWYPGAPRVEGFSNPAWTALMAALHAVGVPDRWVGLGVQVVGLLSTLACVALAGRLAAQVAPRHRRPALDIVALTRWCVAAFVPLGLWAVAGMEVPACAAIVLWCATALGRATDPHAPDGPEYRRWVPVAAAIVVGTTVRLDLLVLLGPLVAVAVAVRRPRPGMWPLVAAPVAIAVQALARHAHYGAWLPNTFRLKSSGLVDAEQLGSGVTIGVAAIAGSLALFTVLVAVGTTVVARVNRLQRPLGLAVAASLPITLAYVVWIGGDYMDAGNAGALGAPNRFLTTAVPLVAPVAALGVATAAERLGVGARWRALATTAAGAAASVVAVVGAWGLWRGYWVSTAAVNPTAVDTVARWAVVASAVAAAAVGAVAVTSRDAGRVATTLVLALAVVTGTGTVRDHLVDDGYRVQRERAVYGRALHDAADPATTVAVAAAGSQVYFSELPAIDQLGKMDRRIAEGPVRQHPFIAGHSKWDDRYSLLELEPDVVVDLWGATSETIAALDQRGYRRAGAVAGVGTGGPLLAPDAGVDAARLCAGLANTLARCDPAT